MIPRMARTRRRRGPQKSGQRRPPPSCMSPFEVFATTPSTSGIGALVFDVAAGHKFIKRIPTFDVPEGRGKRENVRVLRPAWHWVFLTSRRRGGCSRSTSTPSAPCGTANTTAAAIAWRSRRTARLMYLPSLEKAHWHVVDAADGDVIAKVETNSGAHNTVYGARRQGTPTSRAWARRCSGCRPATHTVAQTVGPFGSPIRPFTVNGRETLRFVNVNGLLGFEVGDLRPGKMLHRVEVQGSSRAGQTARLPEPWRRPDAR